MRLTVAFMLRSGCGRNDSQTADYRLHGCPRIGSTRYDAGVTAQSAAEYEAAWEHLRRVRRRFLALVAGGFLAVASFIVFTDGPPHRGGGIFFALVVIWWLFAAVTVW